MHISCASFNFISVSPFPPGFKGERENWRKGNTIAVKTHRFDDEHISSFDGAILIIRNPYKAIISEHNRKFGGHTGFASEKHYTQGTGIYRANKTFRNQIQLHDLIQ